MNPELMRLRTYKHGELSESGDAYTIQLQLGKNADAVYRMILDVMEKIVSSGLTSWPNDDSWRQRLPDKFLEAFPAVTKEDATRMLRGTPRELWDSLPWDFGSWLDAIRVRAWQWWSHDRSGDQMIVVVKIIELPAHIEALEQLFRAAGSQVIAENRIARSGKP
jgi:hypothetical protein